jgi:hypothetical protein
MPRTSRMSSRPSSTTPSMRVMRSAVACCDAVFASIAVFVLAAAAVLAARHQDRRPGHRGARGKARTVADMLGQGRVCAEVDPL